MTATMPTVRTKHGTAVAALPVVIVGDDGETSTEFVAISAAMASATAGAISSVNDTASDTTILAANTSRKGATFFNDSTAILYLAFANTTSSATNFSVKLQAGGYFELGGYTGIVKGIWAADASGACRVTEFT